MIYEHTELLVADFGAEDWLVEGVVSARDRVLLVARYKAGKSIWGQQLAHCVAGPYPFLTFQVPEQKIVLYIAGEGELDEWQSRARAMNRVLPVGAKRLFLWPLPKWRLNTDRGTAALIEAAEEVKKESGGYPALTIFDPVYALFKGSLRDDEAVNEFTHTLNVYQHETGSALVVLHHERRPMRTQTGELTDDQSYEAFLGSALWLAWCRTLFMMRVAGRARDRVWAPTEIVRRNTALVEPITLTLIEPSPLLLVPKKEGLTGLDQTVYHNLLDGPKTFAELEALTGKSRTGIGQAIDKLVGQGRVGQEDSVSPILYVLRAAP